MKSPHSDNRRMTMCVLLQTLVGSDWFASVNTDVCVPSHTNSCCWFSLDHEHNFPLNLTESF